MTNLKSENVNSNPRSTWLELMLSKCPLKASNHMMPAYMLILQSGTVLCVSYLLFSWIIDRIEAKYKPQKCNIRLDWVSFDFCKITKRPEEKPGDSFVMNFMKWESFSPTVERPLPYFFKAPLKAQYSTPLNGRIGCDRDFCTVGVSYAYMCRRYAHYSLVHREPNVMLRFRFVCAVQPDSNLVFDENSNDPVV